MTPYLPRIRFRLTRRILAWNALILAAGLLLLALGAEAYFRLTLPFVERSLPVEFVPDVGLLRRPNTEMRHANNLDYWTIARSNSLGFIDREPPEPARAAASCHIAVIGDSYVEALQVPVREKFQSRLEELARQEAPNLDVTTSAFGREGTGQINQLAFYDEYVRPLRPNVVALVWVVNDVADNHPALSGLQWGIEPDRLPLVSAAKDANGAIRLRPPHPPGPHRLAPRPSPSLWGRAWGWLTDVSYAAVWMDARLRRPTAGTDPEFEARAAALARLPGYEASLDGWEPTNVSDLQEYYGQPDPPPVFREALEFTAFALDQFAERAERDGVALVILAAQIMGGEGSLFLEKPQTMAEERGIPVINQHDYIVRQGGNLGAAYWPNDAHWSLQGHQWAAEALLEWLRENQEVCGDEG